MMANYVSCKHGTGYWDDQTPICDKCRITQLEAELKGSYGELIALARICGHPTSEEMSREKLKRLEEATT